MEISVPFGRYFWIKPLAFSLVCAPTGNAHSDAAQLAELVARLDAGDLQIEVAERRPLTDPPTVHDQAAAGRLPGKTVLIP